MVEHDQFAASFRISPGTRTSRPYGTGSPADMIDVQYLGLWDQAVKNGRIRNVRLVPLGDERLRAADGKDNGGDVDITIDSNGVDEWVDMIGLWYKGQVRRPYAGAVRDVAFPMTVKPPSGAPHTLAFGAIGVQVVHDRKFEGGAGYADTQYFMKFPVPHDWSVKGGWTPMQYSWLRERLAEFPVFDLEELKGTLRGRRPDGRRGRRRVVCGGGGGGAMLVRRAASARARKAPRAEVGRMVVLVLPWGYEPYSAHESTAGVLCGRG